MPSRAAIFSHVSSSTSADAATPACAVLPSLPRGNPQSISASGLSPTSICFVVWRRYFLRGMLSAIFWSWRVIPFFSARCFELELTLQIHPEFGRGVEISCKPERSVRGDALLLMDYALDARPRHGPLALAASFVSSRLALASRSTARSRLHISALKFSNALQAHQFARPYLWHAVPR